MERTELGPKLISALRQSGLRLTPQRAAICELLTQSPIHPTAQQIYETLQPRFPSLSLATVYNTLDRLVSIGVINELGTVGDDAIHYDADVLPHVNLACVSCKKVVDLPNEHITHVASEVEATSNYRLLGARVLYYGLCPECLARRAAQSAATEGSL